MTEHKFKVPALDAGQRLDLFMLKFLKSQGLEFSRSFLQKMIVQGNVTVASAGGQIPTVGHYKIKAGDEIKVFIPRPQGALPAAENIPLDIVFEDDNLLVVNKPIGLVVHPGAGNSEHTLVNALLGHCKELSTVNPQRPGVVHRLDKETSGLLVAAKNNFAHLHLSKQFAEHSVLRTYIAIVDGEMEFDEHVIEIPIGRHPFKRKNMAVGFGSNTRYAKTFYRTLKRCQAFSVLELHPFTGRTHQLRVHLAFIKHPILGDPKYGRASSFVRLALHARSIGFIHPATGKSLEFSSELPPEFKIYMEGAIIAKIKH